MRAVFVTDNPLNDFTLPLIALVRGKKASDHAAGAISAMSAIEELPQALLLRLLRSHHRPHP